MMEAVVADNGNLVCVRMPPARGGVRPDEVCQLERWGGGGRHSEYAGVLRVGGTWGGGGNNNNKKAAVTRTFSALRIAVACERAIVFATSPGKWAMRYVDTIVGCAVGCAEEGWTRDVDLQLGQAVLIRSHETLAAIASAMHAAPRWNAQLVLQAGTPQATTYQDAHSVYLELVNMQDFRLAELQLLRLDKATGKIVLCVDRRFGNKKKVRLHTALAVLARAMDAIGRAEGGAISLSAMQGVDASVGRWELRTGVTMMGVTMGGGEGSRVEEVVHGRTEVPPPVGVPAALAFDTRARVLLQVFGRYDVPAPQAGPFNRPSAYDEARMDKFRLCAELARVAMASNDGAAQAAEQAKEQAKAAATSAEQARDAERAAAAAAAAEQARAEAAERAAAAEQARAAAVERARADAERTVAAAAAKLQLYKDLAAASTTQSGSRDMFSTTVDCSAAAAQTARTIQALTASMAKVPGAAPERVQLAQEAEQTAVWAECVHEAAQGVYVSVKGIAARMAALGISR